MEAECKRALPCLTKSKQILDEELEVFSLPRNEEEEGEGEGEEEEGEGDGDGEEEGDEDVVLLLRIYRGRLSKPLPHPLEYPSATP